MYRESTFQPENADFYLKNSLKFKSQIKHTQYEGKEKMNKIMLIGNLTRDPEISTTPSGVSVCKFTLAVQRNFSNSEGVREADFFNVSAWRALGESCAKFLKKGNKACVIGNVILRSYDGNDGVKRFVLDVTASDVEFLTPRQNDGGDGDSQEPVFEKPKPAKKIELQQVSDDDLPF